MNVSELITVAIISATPPTIAAIGAIAVGIRNTKKSDEIHKLVNSQLTAVKAELVIANTKIIRLQKFIANKND